MSNHMGGIYSDILIFNLSYIFISHDINVIRSMADYIMVLKNGKIVEHGKANSIFQLPQNEYTKKLITSVI